MTCLKVVNAMIASDLFSAFWDVSVIGVSVLVCWDGTYSILNWHKFINDLIHGLHCFLSVEVRVFKLKKIKCLWITKIIAAYYISENKTS